VELFLDDRKTEVALAPHAPLHELLAETKKRLAETGRLIVGIQCEGLDITGDGFGQALGEPLSSYGRIDMQSAEPARLIAEATDTSTRLLDETERTTAEIAEQLARGEAQDSLPKLAQCCQAWLQIHEGICNSAHMLGVKPDTHEIDGATLGEMMATPIAQLTQIKEAIEAQDYVLLADMLTYEFSESVTVWRKILADLSKTAPTT